MVTSVMRQLARDTVRLTQKLGDTARATPAPGYIRTFHRTYCDLRIAEQLTMVYTRALELGEVIQDPAISRYQLAGHLMILLRLDEAASLCELNIDLSPNSRPPDLHLLTIIEARRGNLDRALAIVDQLAKDPRASAFRVTAEQIREEHQRGVEDRMVMASG